MDDLKVIDNGLVPVYETDKGIKVVYGRDLYSVLEVKSRFNDWITNRLSDCDAVDSEDFTTLTKNLVNGGREKEYIIKLDIAKEMAMLERNDKGKEVRKYFIEVEKKFKAAVVDRSQLSPQMQMLYGLIEQQAKQELEQKRIAEEQKRNSERMDKIEQSQKSMRDAFEPIHEETWRKDVSLKFNRVQKQSEIPFQELWTEMYKELDRRAGVDTAKRLKNRRDRMRADGVSETNIKRTTRMDVIQEDKKLRAIFERILTEYEIKYCN